MSLALKSPCDEGGIRSAGQAILCDARTRRWVLAAAILGSSIAFIDGTVINVALPVIQERLSASVTGAQWIVEAYMLGLSALLLVGGALGDRLGRRRVFVAGVTVFAIASAACGLAQNVGELVAARACQGVGGALLIPGSLALIGSAFPAERRGRAIGAWSAMTSVATVIGPVLGGWLVQTASWRTVFWINLPLAAAVIVISIWKVPESRQSGTPRLDLAGAALATLGLAGLVFGLIESAGSSLPRPLVLGVLASGAVMLALFLLVERTSTHPMVPLDLFRSRPFLGANLVTLCLYAALSATMLFLSFDLIQAQGFTPTAAGAAFVPFIVLVSSLSRWSGGLLDRVGPRLPLTAGPAVAAAGFALLAIPSTHATYWSGFFPGICVLGLGMAITIAPLTTVVMNGVDPSREGLASGINNAVSRIGGLLAIAVLGLPVTAVFSRSLDRRLASGGLAFVSRQIPQAERLKLGTVRPPPQLAAAQARVVSEAIAAALADSFRVVAVVSATLALLAAALGAWFFANHGTLGRHKQAVPRRT
jgi:EmrB/QacA subfamily drug resistance transporter